MISQLFFKIDLFYFYTTFSLTFSAVIRGSKGVKVKGLFCYAFYQVGGTEHSLVAVDTDDMSG